MKRWFKQLMKPASRAGEVAQPQPDHRRLGDAARDRREWATASRHYALHLETFPQDFGIWVQMGHVLKEHALLEEAEHAYAGAIQLNDRDPDVWLHRAHLAKMRRQTLMAREFYTRSYAIDANPDASAELLGLGVSTAELHVPGRGDLALAQVLERPVGRIEAYDGAAVTGWAIDPEAPDLPAEVEVLCNGRIIARGKSSGVREDPRPGHSGERLAGFSIDLGEKVRIGDAVTARLKRTGEDLASSPLVLEPSIEARRWLGRLDGLTPDDIAANKAGYARETAGMRLSIIMPISYGSEEWLGRAIDSVLAQWCSHWELLCIDDGSNDAAIRETLKKHASRDPRIRIVESGDDKDAAGALEAGVRASSGDYVALMHRRSYLEPEAVFRFLDAGKSRAGIIYSDEIATTDDIDDLRDFLMRPAFSYDHFLSHPDLGQVVCFRADLARAAIGLDKARRSSGSIDFILRVLESSAEVAHVPAILHRSRRCRSDDLNRNPAQKNKAILGALNRHLERSGSGAVAEPGFQYGNYRIDYPDDRGRTLIIIPTRDRVDLLEACLESIWRTTNANDVEIVVIDHESAEPKSRRYLQKIRKRVTVVPFSGKFNYAKMNNEIAGRYGRNFKYLVFMNNDIEARSEPWLERMRALAGRPDVGIVGATLLYGDGRIQHSGVVLGVVGAVYHAHKFTPLAVDGIRTPGPNASLISTRDYVAVTGACVMMRSELFFGVGGFDESLVVDYNDIDICLRLGSLGYRILNDAHAVLYHHESATRKLDPRVERSAETAIFTRRWHQLLASGDPFYNPLLSLVTDHAPGHILDVYHPVRIHAVKPVLQPLLGGRARHVAAPLVYPVTDARP